jgi:uncharacterized membrane protein YdbT with pleckstrin-like domain
MTHPANRFRSSTLGWLRGTLAGWATLLLFLAGLVGTVMAGGDALDVPPGSPLILSGLALAILGWRWLSNLATTYELYDDRLILHRGILMKSIDEIELYRVKDVRLDFSVVNQLAGIGTITITSSDETTRHGALVIRHVAHARPRREQLRTKVNAARQQRGVREIDMAHEDL